MLCIYIIIITIFVSTIKTLFYHTRIKMVLKNWCHKKHSDIFTNNYNFSTKSSFKRVFKYGFNENRLWNVCLNTTLLKSSSKYLHILYSFSCFLPQWELQEQSTFRKARVSPSVWPMKPSPWWRLPLPQNDIALLPQRQGLCQRLQGENDPRLRDQPHAQLARWSQRFPGNLAS